MQVGKLKQFGLILCCIASLLVSSVTACTCDHKSGHVETSQHCQPSSQQTHAATATAAHSTEVKEDSSHSHGETIAAHNHDDNRVETNISVLSFSEQACCCIKPAPKVYAKSETVKTEKQAPGILPHLRFEIDFSPQIVSVKTPEFIRPFYLSDSFYNVSPGRAPPRL